MQVQILSGSILICYRYFKGIKFRGFRGFRKKLEIKSRRKICNCPSAKLNPHEKVFFKTNLYSLYSIQNVGLGFFLKCKNHCCFVVGSYFSYFNLLFYVQPKFAKKVGQVPYAKFAKYFEMLRPRN